MSINQEIAEAIAQIQSKQTLKKEQFKSKIKEILGDELFAMTEFGSNEKLAFYLRSHPISVTVGDAKTDLIIIFALNGKACHWLSSAETLRADLIKAIATVEIAEAKADHEFEKLPLHQKFWRYLQTFWK